MAGKPMSVCKHGHDMSITRKRHKNGTTYCSVCKLRRTRDYRKDNPDKSLKYSRKCHTPEYKLQRTLRKRGLSLEQYHTILAVQENRCAICGGDDWSGYGPHIDHCHKTDVVRGLLCRYCNLALGQFKDSPSILTNAIAYLDKHQPTQKAE